MTTIYSYFADTIIKSVYPDLKRVYSRRAHALFLYSEQYNQLIYIKLLKTKMKHRDLLLNLERGINDIDRMFKQEYGPRQGTKRFNETYKLQIIVCPRVYKPLYRHLWALNRLGKTDKHTSTKTFNTHTYHMIFDSSKIKDMIIAGTIYGALYKKMNAHLESIKLALKQRKKTAFDKVKTNINDLTASTHKLQSLHYQFIGERVLSPEMKAEITTFSTNYRNATMEPDFNNKYQPEIKFEKEPYKTDMGVQ